MLLRMFARTWLAGLLISSATAQEPTALLPLPRMEACRSNSHPRLPAQWRASYLMAPFNKAQLVLGEIVFDAGRPAMRVKLFGVKRGSRGFIHSRPYHLRA